MALHHCVDGGKGDLGGAIIASGYQRGGDRRLRRRPVPSVEPNQNGQGQQEKHNACPTHHKGKIKRPQLGSIGIYRHPQGIQGIQARCHDQQQQAYHHAQQGQDNQKESMKNAWLHINTTFLL